ncbi:DoxX family protein [Kitasatospora hibisci]|uniref:DoxX family protein n=1 Tax=Kitasatospora hibisci TaxID=3369522 RepID=UPI003754FA2B
MNAVHWNAAYWVVAVPLALFYLYAGGLKAVRSREQLLPMMAWVDSTPMPTVRTLGAVEVLGAAGLVLPPLTGIAPSVALAAAVGFTLLQIAATGVHLRRGDRRIGLNAALLLAAVATVPLATARL